MPNSAASGWLIANLVQNPHRCNGSALPVWVGVGSIKGFSRKRTNPLSCQILCCNSCNSIQVCPSITDLVSTATMDTGVPVKKTGDSKGIFFTLLQQDHRRSPAFQKAGTSNHLVSGVHGGAWNGTPADSGPGLYHNSHTLHWVHPEAGAWPRA